jgi:hypothetical protein
MSDGLTREDLVTLVTELRKPAPPTDAQRAAAEMRNQSRLRNAKESAQKEKNIKATQKRCQHRQKGGMHESLAVYIPENGPSVAGSPGYIMCQSCQIRVRPGEFAGNIDSNTGCKCDLDKSQPVWFRDCGATYDTDLFNKLMQECNSGDVMV